MASKKKPVAARPKAKSAASAAAELSGSTEVALINSGPVTFALPPGVKAKRVVTVPSLVLKTAGDARTLYFADAMRVSKVVDKTDSKREPATVATVGDVETGEQFIFLVPSVVKANLERDYPDESYVGCSFFIQNMGKRTESQRYNDFRIIEVDITEITKQAAIASGSEE